MKRLLGLIFVFFIGYGVSTLWVQYENAQCKPEPVAEAEIAGTDWIAQQRGIFCGFGIGALTDIIVIKKNGRSLTTVATGSGIDHAILNGSVDHTLEIFVPAGAPIVMSGIVINGLDIVLKHYVVDAMHPLPEYDPAATPSRDTPGPK